MESLKILTNQTITSLNLLDVGVCRGISGRSLQVFLFNVVEKKREKKEKERARKEKSATFNEILHPPHSVSATMTTGYRREA